MPECPDDQRGLLESVWTSVCQRAGDPDEHRLAQGLHPRNADQRLLCETAHIAVRIIQQPGQTRHCFRRAFRFERSSR